MRLNSPEVKIGSIKLGGNNPIVIQSMTNTDTSDAKSTALQIIELAEAGSELVRITVNDESAAKAVPEIRKILDSNGYQQLPLIGDFHYNGHKLLRQFPELAKTLDKYRINPGNVGFGEKHDYNFKEIIEIAIENNKPVRIGVNWGSLDQELFTQMMEENSKKKNPLSDNEVTIEAMVESALRSAKLAEEIGLGKNKIVISVKMSVVQDMISAYLRLFERMKNEQNFYALHLGLTEAGSGIQGLVSSSAALAILLQQGIGDTIRISLTPKPDQKRSAEVQACKTLLQSMGYRNFRPKVTSCPGCGRTDSTYFLELANEVNEHIEKNMKSWKKEFPGVEKLKIAVMGCVVNGPGESRHADIAISLPGKGEDKMAPVYLDGKFTKTLTGDKIPEQFIEILEGYIQENF